MLADLGKLHNEFDQHGNSADGCEGELGHGGLKDAFDEFSATWKKTRKKRSKELNKLAYCIGTAAQKYEEIDHKLAKAIAE
ncbi:hypothetical protein [Streptomyces sp. NPDC001714]|uniref:hypothetical protein n=1 Tax=Streptomyces sp. NPDC001714 TaxID=3364603 RepID=UPI0036743267